MRALAPKPGVVLEDDALGALIVLRAHVAADGTAGIAVRARDGTVAIDQVVPPGKRPMPAADFLRGRVPK